MGLLGSAVLFSVLLQTLVRSLRNVLPILDMAGFLMFTSAVESFYLRMYARCIVCLLLEGKYTLVISNFLTHQLLLSVIQTHFWNMLLCGFPCRMDESKGISFEWWRSLWKRERFAESFLYSECEWAHVRVCTHTSQLAANGILLIFGLTLFLLTSLAVCPDRGLADSHIYLWLLCQGYWWQRGVPREIQVSGWKNKLLSTPKY